MRHPRATDLDKLIKAAKRAGLERYEIVLDEHEGRMVAKLVVGKGDEREMEARLG